MKLALSSCAVVALLASANAFAADAPAAAEPAPAPEHTFTANVGLFSQYVFRGISQTKAEPALQGGLDYAHSSGLYIGTWASNISWLRDSNYQDGSAEIDIYAGYKNAIGETGISYDVGVLQYYYPGSIIQPAGKNADTTELYGALTWQWFTAKISSAVSSGVFGAQHAAGTWYLDLAANYPIADTGVTAGLHYGRQDYQGSGNSSLSYNDWRASLAYDLGKLGEKLAGTEAGLVYTSNDTKGTAYDTHVFAGRDQVTAYLKRTF